MSCNKVKLFQFDSEKDLLSTFYPQIFKDNLENDELKEIKKKFFEETFFDLSIISKLAVFVKDNQILVTGFEPNCESNQYNKNIKNQKFKKQLKLDENESISSVRIFPSYSNKSSLSTYIIIGLKSVQPVYDIKLFSHHNELKQDQLDQTIFLQFDNFCIKIDGLQLISVLKQNETKLQSDQIPSNNVFYEIWYLKRSFNDFIYCGLIYEPIYDNLIQQSLFSEDSYFRVREQRSIKYDLMVTVGSELFLSFYDLNKIESEVTIKEAVTSIVSSFFFNKPNQDQKPKFSSNNATLIFNINKNTSGNQQIVQYSNRNLALVYDCLSSKDATISLIDLRRKEVIRFWKDSVYKNCQFSFIEINNSLNKGLERTLFICFYLPDSKSVEIWPSRFDDKIVSIEVGSNCILLNNQNIFKAKGLSIDDYIPSTILFDFDTFECFTFDVSFLCAFTDYKINSRDDLLLKEVPRTINNAQFKKEDLKPIIKKLTSPENKLTILKMMFEKNDLELIEFTINCFEQLSTYKSIEEQSLLINFKFVTQLSELYVYMNEKNEKLKDFTIKKNIIKETPLNITEETELLKWKETDFTRIFPLFIFSEHLDPNDLQFKLPLLTIQEFMSFFNLNLNNDELVNSEICKVNLKAQEEHLHKLSTFLFAYLILKEQDLEIIQFYLKHSVSALDLIYLLFHAWSSNKFTYNWKAWSSLLLIGSYLVEEYKKEVKNEQLFKRNLINCLKQACGLFLSSSFIQASIVGTYTIQVIYSLFCKKDRQIIDNYTISDEDEWVEISLDEESFSSVLKQLGIEDIYLLNLLLQCGNSEPDLQISLFKLVKSKNSLTGELVAKHCTRNLIDANVIANLDFKEEEDANGKIKIESNFKTEVDKTLKMLNETDEDLFGQLLRHVQLRFPCNLNTSVLLANCAWQSILKFTNNPTINNQVHLQQCLNYLDRIKDLVLKHKVALLIWKVFLSEKFEKINKIIFNERNWAYENFEDLDMEATLEPFVTFVSDFIEFIYNTIDGAINSVQINYNEFKDDWWLPKKDKTILENPQKSIIEFALKIPVAKYNITRLHSQLALLTNLTINFKENMITSLKNCFSQTVTCFLYKDLNIDLSLDDDNEYLKKSRERILMRFTQNIGRSVPIVTIRSPNEFEKECFRQANSWISKLIELAQEWDIDSKFVKTNYVFTLYLFGCDVLAKEELYSINDEEFVGRMFLQLIPSRLITLYGKNIYNIISLLPNEIVQEIQRNPNQRVEFEVTLDSTRQFTESCISKLSEGLFFKIVSSVLQVILQNY